jgi:hypothetical protein
MEVQLLKPIFKERFMKKLLVAVAVVCLAVSSGFASWDYFPPKDAGSGEAKLTFEFGIPMEKVTTMGLKLGARYTIIDGLEASVKLPIPLSRSLDGNSQDDYAGLSIPEIGVRYWLPMGLGFFVDALLPVDTRDNIEPDFDMVLGVQYSMSFTDEISFGSQVGLLNLITDPDIGLQIGVEVGYDLGMAAPYLGIELPDLLADDFKMNLVLGAGIAINDMFSADVSLDLGVTGYKSLEMDTTTFQMKEKNDLPITIGASFSFKF